MAARFTGPQFYLTPLVSTFPLRTLRTPSQDQSIRKELTSKFSVAVSYSEDEHGGSGKIVTVQGKVALEIAAFVTDRFGIPRRHVQIAGKTGKGKGSGGGGKRR